MAANEKNRPRLIVNHQACLQGASSGLVGLLKQKLTLDNPKYRDACKYGRWLGKKLKPRISFYHSEKDLLCFPRGFARQVATLCHKIEGKTPEIIDQRLTLPATDYSFCGSLRPYQQEAVDRLLTRDFGVLEAGTGAGKTVLACAVFAARRQPVLVLVHSKELLYQWAERIADFLGLSPGLIGDGKEEIKPVTVAIVNSARSRLNELPAHFGMLCVDECHRVPANLFTDVVSAFHCRYMLGLSATAYRRDGLTSLIYFYLGDRVHRIETSSLQESGAILKAELRQKPTGFRFVYRDNYQAMMKALTEDKERNRLISEEIAKEQENRSNGTILVVSDRVEHCHNLAKLLAEKGIASRILTGSTPREERQQLVEELRQGRIGILISTVQLIGEGFDCPGLGCLFLTTPIKFSGRLLQIVGRILRPASGKKAVVYDFVDPVGVLLKSAENRARILS